MWIVKIGLFYSKIFFFKIRDLLEIRELAVIRDLVESPGTDMEYIAVMNTEQKIDQALNLFESGCNCSQAVSAVFAEEGGYPESDALAGMAPFGAGICYRQNICGALSGGLYALGRIFGPEDAGDADGRDTAYGAGRDFLQRFEEEYGTISCARLLDLDITTEKGLLQARETGVFVRKCPGFIASAVRAAAETIVLFKR